MFVCGLGYKLAHAAERFDMGGRDVTEYLARLLRGRGYVFTETGWLPFLNKNAQYSRPHTNAYLFIARFALSGKMYTCYRIKYTY